MKKMFQAIANAVKAPFKWGYQVVDTRPPGSAYRHTAKELHAVESGNPNEIAFVIGSGFTEKLPVFITVEAHTPAEAANATLRMMSNLRRSEAKVVHRTHKSIVAEHRRAQKKAEADRAAQETALGNAASESSGSQTHSSAESGPAGDPVLMPA